MANTDDSWDKIGRADPYYGVLSHERFRRSSMVDDISLEFFKSGEEHVQRVFETVRAHIDADFSPQSALDFGCGVGRIAIPLARRIAKVVAADVSGAMLSEAGRNCAEQNIDNVQLIKTDDTLSTVPSNLEFIHSPSNQKNGLARPQRTTAEYSVTHCCSFTRHNARLPRNI